MSLLKCVGGLWVVVLSVFVCPGDADAAFRAGFAKADITPQKPVPMWGYGDRHAALSKGVLDPLYAKAVVIEAGGERLAIVGLDLGRSPRADQMVRIRQAVQQQSGVGHLLISGSHTHHGPVIELLDEEGKGRGTFDDAVAYANELESRLIAVINAAAASLEDAQIGWGTTAIDMNRNRHSGIEPKPRDTELGVIRIDHLSGKPLVVIANFAAHPTMVKGEDLRFSADWPGQMMNAVEAGLGTNCIFMQGAAGDLSTKTTEETRGHELFGRAIAVHVQSVASSISTSRPEKPSIASRSDIFEFPTRLPFSSPLIQAMFSAAFFPELAQASLNDDLKSNIIHPELTTVLLNGQLALVGGSGEFFCSHSVRLKERSRADETFFFGYCNGHHMYLPTIEGAAEGGYGADSTVSWVSLGAGEEMMDQALINIYSLLGKFPENSLTNTDAETE
ncbi:MAG: neutral/alkaline non-lysosomal ceramidase N-terminal domain-containing protein [Planctomyces sp.]|nr:neutral/alkaline non-lysosomal ceramidase N-terminal domain-containing protein [Planctomyces sp.]